MVKKSTTWATTSIRLHRHWDWASQECFTTNSATTRAQELNRICRRHRLCITYLLLLLHPRISATLCHHKCLKVPPLVNGFSSTRPRCSMSKAQEIMRRVQSPSQGNPLHLRSERELRSRQSPFDLVGYRPCRPCPEKDTRSAWIWETSICSRRWVSSGTLSVASEYSCEGLTFFSLRHRDIRSSDSVSTKNLAKETGTALSALLCHEGARESHSCALASGRAP